MMDIDVVEQLRTAVTYGYMPRRMREVADKAAAEIERLRAELAARDAEIADWMLESASAMPVEPRLVVKDFALAIASGAYRGQE